MANYLRPEEVYRHLRNGKLPPFYLFSGPAEFLKEKILSALKNELVPESWRDLNYQVFYADEDEVKPGLILDAARSVPFMSGTKLVVVRNTESFAPGSLEMFIPYLEDPSDSTCLIFLSTKTDSRTKFFRKFKECGLVVDFRKLFDSEVIPWIKKTAKELGIEIDGPGCSYLQQIVGNRMRDLYGELEKLYLLYGKGPVGPNEIKRVVSHSRNYTVFELMDKISFKKWAESITVLRKFLGAGDRQEEVLGILGMLNRQICLLWKTKSIMNRGGTVESVSGSLGIKNFIVRKMVQQSKGWTEQGFEHALEELYKADKLIKTGSPPYLVLENVVFSICTS